MKKSTTVATMANGLLKVLQRYTKGIRLVAVLTMLFTVGVGSMLGAEEESLACPLGTISDNTMTWELNSCTVVHAKGSNNNYAEYSPWRVYQGAIVTFTPKANISISKIVITAGSTAYASAGAKTWTNATATASGSTITVTPTDQTKVFSITASAQTRWSNIEITYTSAGSEPPTPPTTYTIKWHTAVGITTDDILNEGATITKPATDPTMAGYEFMGWTEDCKVASDGAGFTAISNFGTATEDKDYYAVFAIATNPSGGGATETTASVKIQNYASANSWANGTKYTSVKIDENITASVSGSSNTGKYYTSGHEWRLYQTESAKLTISATEGKTIKTAKITYNVSNTGVLKLNSSNVTSGKNSTINASSVTYNVGNSASETNGQVKVTAIEVVYTSGAGGGGSTTYSEYITTCSKETSYSVTYDSNDATSGSVPEDNNEYTANSSVTVLGNTSNLAKTGYTFNGWNTQADGNGTAYQSGKTFIITENTTLYAQWQANTYKVSFNANGGDGTMIDQNFTYDEAKKALSKNTFTRTGHTFNGWNTQDNGQGTTYTDQQSVNNLTEENNETITLYAQWKIQTFTVTFNSNDGTGTMTSQTFTYNQAQTLTANAFKRTGYTFTGWNTKSDGLGDSYTDKQSITLTAAGLTLYAQWKANTYTVKFDGNGSDGGSMKDQSFTYDQSQNLTANAYVRTGYAFKHWTINQDGTGTSYSNEQSVNNLTAEDKATVTLYAQWTPNVYEITLHTNGGTINAGNVTSYKYGAGATLPTNVTKEHYQFGGWFDNSGCTGTAVTTISTTATGDKEYWAKWTELPKYTVTWSVDGSTTTEEVYSGDKATKAPTIDENNLPCDGADKFEGWTTGEYQGDSEPGTLYPNAADIPAITGNITFYAVFADYAD